MLASYSLMSTTSMMVVGPVVGGEVDEGAPLTAGATGGGVGFPRMFKIPCAPMQPYIPFRSYAAGRAGSMHEAQPP